MKIKSYKIISYFLSLAVMISLAVSNVSAEEESRATGYDKSFSYKEAVQTYIVPASGYYKLEVWGAQGGSVTGRGRGGYGGYSVGYQYFTKDTVLNVVVGGQGLSGTFDEEKTDHGLMLNGGYNGGGKGGFEGAGGGGATHIATRTGLLSTLSGNQDSVLIVAGGGGGGAYSNLYGADNGGSGGGLNGGSVIAYDRDDDGNIISELVRVEGGTQSAGGTTGNSKPEQNGSFGKGGNGPYMDTAIGNWEYWQAGGGGGAGWYGGKSGWNYNGGMGGAGGSGYIGGCLPRLTYRGSTYTSSTATSSNSGNGKAAITYLGPIYYRQMVQVRYENADGTFTEYEDEVGEDYAVDDIFTWTREADSTYQEASVSYTVAEERTTQITVYRKQYMLTLEKGTGIDTVSGEGEYRTGQTVTIDAEVTDGYEFSGWSDSRILTETESTYEFEMPANDLSYMAIAVPIEYPSQEENEPEYEPEDDNDPGNESGGEEPILPVPTPTPTLKPTPTPTSVDNGLNALGEEVEMEEAELTQMQFTAPATPTPVIKEKGTINIPIENVGVVDSDLNDNSFWKIAAAIACAGAIGGIIFLVLFWFLRKCKIYDAQTEELVGKSIIRKDRKGMFWIKISDTVCDMAGTKIYIIFGDNFVRSYPEKLLKISARGKEFYRQIQKKVDLELEK